MIVKPLPDSENATSIRINTIAGNISISEIDETVCITVGNFNISHFDDTKTQIITFSSDGAVNGLER